jgi:PAS domain S-box-containing protein
MDYPSEPSVSEGSKRSNKHYSLLTVIISGGISTLLGIIVIIGWYTHNQNLIQVNPSFVPMQYNTALGFLLGGIALVLLYFNKERLAAFVGLTVLLLGIITIFEYLFGINLYLDQLFMKHYITTKTSHPGRMSPTTAFCFSLTGISLIINYLKMSRSIKYKLILLLGSIVIFMGLFSIIGYLLGMESIYDWSKFSKMAIHTSTGFIFLGIGLFTRAWHGIDGSTFLNSSLKRKLLAYILIPVAFTYFFVATYNIYKIKDITTDATKNHLRELAWRSASQLENQLDLFSEIGRSTRRFLITQSDLNESEIYDALRKNLNSNELVYGSTITFAPYAFDKNRRLFAPYAFRDGEEIKFMDIGVDGYDYTNGEWDWYSLPIKLKKSVWTEPYFDEGAGNIWMCTYSVPVYRNEEIWAVVTIDIPLSVMGTFVNVIDQDNHIHRTIDIISNEGTYIHSSISEELTGKNIFTHYDTGNMDSEDWKSLAKDRIEGNSGYSEIDQKGAHRFLAFYVPVAGADWNLLLGDEETHAMSTVRKIIFEYSIIFILVSALFVAIVILAARNITNPLLQLNKAANQFARDKTFSTCDIDSDDEIGDLALTFSKMANDIGERMKELNCLYHIAQFTSDLNLTLKEVFQKSVDVIPESWQYPEITCGRIKLNGDVYTTDVFKESEWKQETDILAENEKIGTIEVFYLEEMPDSDIGPFLQEEQVLIEGIANLLGNYSARNIAKEALILHQEQLEDKVEQRTLALKELENRSRLLLESAGEGIFGVNQLGEITFVNPAASKMLGYSVNELIGEKVHQLIHHSYSDHSHYPIEECPMYAAYTKGTEQRVSNESLWRKDGTGFPVEYTSTPIQEDGNLNGAVVTFTDITQRKEAEAEVLESKNRTDSILKASTNGIIAINSEGIIETFNPAAQQIFGYESDEIIGQNVKILVPDEHSKNHDQYLKNYLTTGIKNVIGKRLEVPAKRKNGDLFQIEIGINEVESKDSKLFMAIVSDITQRKKDREELESSKAQIQNILDTSPVGVAISSSGILRMVNPKANEMFGSKVGEPSPELYVDPKDREVLVGKLKTEGKVENYELQMYNTDKDIRDILVTYLPIDYEGTNSILGWLHDITERKEKEEAVRKSQEMLTTTIDSLGHPFYVVDANDYSIVLANEAARQLAKNGTITTCHALTHKSPTPCDSLEDPCPLKKIRKTKKPVVVEHTHYDKDGNPFYVEVHGYPIFDDDGNLVQMIEYSLNITKRKEAEAELNKKLDELERFNKLVVGREIRMIDLKKEINELLIKTGIDGKYKIVE